MLREFPVCVRIWPQGPVIGGQPSAADDDRQGDEAKPEPKMTVAFHCHQGQTVLRRSAVHFEISQMPTACPLDGYACGYGLKPPSAPAAQRRRTRRWRTRERDGGGLRCVCSGEREVPPDKPGASKVRHTQIQPKELQYSYSHGWDQGFNAA